MIKNPQHQSSNTNLACDSRNHARFVVSIKNAYLTLTQINRKKYKVLSDFHWMNKYVQVYFIGTCPALSLSNGRIEYNKPALWGRYHPGTRATAKCRFGYKKYTGWEKRRCQSSGRWNGYLAKCRKRKESQPLNNDIVCVPKAGPLSSFSLFSSNVLYRCVANHWNKNVFIFYTN